jgi:hypothetical protein
MHIQRVCASRVANSLSFQLVHMHKMAMAKCLTHPLPRPLWVCVCCVCAADLLPVLKVLHPSCTPQEAALVSGVWPLLMHVTCNMPGQLTQDQVSCGLRKSRPGQVLIPTTCTHVCQLPSTLCCVILWAQAPDSVEK